VKIVIAGGGTAGWISAYIIEKMQPGAHIITVIESSSIGILGAGEGSTGALFDLVSGKYFNNYNQKDVLDFMDFTDSTPKFGIRHINWDKTGTGDYFAPLEGSATGEYSPDSIWNHVLATYGAKNAALSSYAGHRYHNNKFPDTDNFGFHFDAFKVGQYFKGKLKNLSNVFVVDSVIKEVELAPNGEIDSLRIEQGANISGDFFIDCTGFARVLSSKMGIKWVSYQDHLLANKAMPFLVDYTPATLSEAQPLTTARALSSGWMWDIPLKTRRGCGYVYNSDFLSEDQAHKEVESVLGHAVSPIRHLSFNAGRAETLWSKNCIASGVSAAFMEPLEATSIHTTIHQMLGFASEYLYKTKKATTHLGNSTSYNNKFNGMYDSYKDFLNLHYQGGRADSEFWKHVSNSKMRTPFVSEVMSRSEFRSPSFMQFEHHWGTSTTLWNYVLAGLDLVSSNSARDALKLFSTEKQSEINYKQLLQYSNNRNTAQGPFSLKGMINENL
jgi:hypothetical protein